MPIGVESPTFESLAGRIKTLSAAIDAGMAETAQTGAGSIQVAAMTKVPVKTGRLRRSIHSTTVSLTAHVDSVIEATAPYAAFVERGTGIYGPRAQPILYNRMLRIPLADGSFRSVLGIKGMRAKAFMKPAWDERIDGIVAAFKDALAKVVATIK